MRIRVVVTLFLGLFSSQFLFAQMPAPTGEGTQPSRAPTDQTPVIRTTTGEVLLDMVVRDKHHHLVTDLRPNEIEIYEDGVRQDLKSFQLVQGAEQLQTERAAAQTAQTRTGNTNLPAATSQNNLKQINFVSIVFAPTAPLNREFAREAVDDFLAGDSLPNTYVTIYTLSRNLNLVQPYTADKQILTAVVDKISRNLSSAAGSSSGTAVAGSAIANTLADSATAAASSSTPPSVTGPPDPMLGQFSGAIYTSPLWARNSAAVDASTPLGAGLEAQSLLWMSQRFDSSQAMSAMDSLRELIRSQEKLPGRKVVLYLSDGLALPSGRPEVFQGLISLANRTGVTFYTVDTRGLSVEDSMIPGQASLGMTGAESRQRGSVTSSVAGYKEMDDAQLVAVSNTQLSMQELAESTGGFAVTNTNQIADPMRQVMEDIRTHYELSYAPKSTTYDGHFRKIDVKLTRPKLAVQTRKGYFALPMLNGEPLQPYEAASLEKINARPMAADFHYDAAVMKFRSNENVVEYVLGFQIPATSLKAVPVAKSDKLRVQASIVAIVRDSNGEVADKISRELWRYVLPGQTGQHIFFSQPLILPRGRYSVDVAVMDELSGKASVQRLSAPPEPAGGIGLSSVEIVRRAEPFAGPANPLNPFELDKALIVPELGDSASSPVTLYFVLYPSKQSSTTASVVLQLLKDGKEFGRQALPVPEPRPDGSVPMVVRVSPGPGSYAIIVTAQQGTLAAQSVRSLQVD